MFFCPKEFFSTKKEKEKDKDNFPLSSMELKLIDKKNNENENNNNENIEEYKTKQTKDILENFVVNDYEDSFGNIANDLSLTIQNSYRYAGW
jgi:valyl-tRNA synthetase